MATPARETTIWKVQEPDRRDDRVRVVSTRVRVTPKQIKRLGRDRHGIVNDPFGWRTILDEHDLVESPEEAVEKWKAQKQALITKLQADLDYAKKLLASHVHFPED